MTKTQKAEREEAAAELAKWIKPGDTVYTILDHVSRSGMSRIIRVLVPLVGEDGKPEFIHPNRAVGKAIGASHGRSNGRETDGLRVDGCGMDMGFHLVNSLSYALYPEYACLGEAGNCPSNYHMNHRDRLRCDGIGSGDDWRPCHKQYRGDRYFREDWPSELVDIGEGRSITRYLAAIEHPDGRLEVCPTCGGAGDVPNPEGPERWDLIHKDGYALRQAWL